MAIPADGRAVGVVARCGQHHDGLLGAGSIGACSQNIPPLPACPTRPCVELIAEDSGEAGAMLVIHVTGIHLHPSAKAGADLPHAGAWPRQWPMLRLPNDGVLHHGLSAAVNDIGVFLVHGKNAHVWLLLAVSQQVVQPQPRCQLALSVFLRDLVIEEAPIPYPTPVIILDLDAVELPDQVALPRKQFKGLASPVILAEHQHGEKGFHTLYGGLVVPQLRAVIRLGYRDARCQGQHLRHSDPCLLGSVPAWGCCPPSPACRYPAPPDGSGW